MYHLELETFDDVAILRYEICKATQVKPERQKILNLKAKGGASQVVPGTNSRF
jgi:hypothetical protein